MASGRIGNYRNHLLAACLGMAALVTAATAGAQSGGGYDLTWSTIDGGGDASFGGGYTVTGAIGQPDAGEMFGGGYRVQGGFWDGAAVENPFALYLPLIMR